MIATGAYTLGGMVVQHQPAYLATIVRVTEKKWVRLLLIKTWQPLHRLAATKAAKGGSTLRFT